MSEGVGKAVSRRFSFALRSLAASKSVFICEVRRQGVAVSQRETAGSCMARWGGGEEWIKENCVEVMLDGPCWV